MILVCILLVNIYRKKLDFKGFAVSIQEAAEAGKF